MMRASERCHAMSEHMYAGHRHAWQDPGTYQEDGAESRIIQLQAR